MDTLFLILSKTVWFFLRPETLLVLFFTLPLLLLWRERVEAATNTLFCALCATVALGFFPLGNLLLNPLERAYPVNPDLSPPAGIIVLGGMEHVAPPHAKNIAQVNDAGERILVTIELANRFPDAKVLFSGGRVVLTPDATNTFSVGPDILRRLGLREERLIVEGHSRTTAENAVLSLERITDQKEGPWVLVTSAWHMPRSMGAFCAAGWQNLIPYPVDFRGGPVFSEVRWSLARNLDALNVGTKEWIGLVAYKLTGRINAYLPRNCGQL